MKIPILLRRIVITQRKEYKEPRKYGDILQPQDATGYIKLTKFQKSVIPLADQLRTLLTGDKDVQEVKHLTTSIC